jgi:HAD superfamily hydrolase (TIGR01509 family)
MKTLFNNWIHTYQLFLFDFDGLLVNTEEIHFLAYKKILANRGFELNWDFSRYARAAHYEADGFKVAIYDEFPELYNQEPNWDILYAEKRMTMLSLLKEGAVQMMPGAADLLQALHEAKIDLCVVTHSPKEQVDIIREKNPILDIIPHWFTRENYTHPKPHPECYLHAIQKLGTNAEKIIGFEDSPRGMRALMQTPADAVLISPIPYPEIPELIAKGARHFPSFQAITEMT